MQSIKYKRVIFLDEEGNGLSPYADFLLKQKLQERGIEGIEVSSRGAVVLFPEPANQKIKELAKMKGLSLEDYQAEALNGTEFSDSTLILTFNAAGKQRIYDNFPGALNVYTFREFVGESGDITLPLGGTLEEYRNVCAVVDRVMDRLLEMIEEHMTAAKSGKQPEKAPEESVRTEEEE